MIDTFYDQGTADIFDGNDSKAARKACPPSLWNVACRKLDQIDSATDLQDLRIPPNNRLESLKGDRAGQYSIRINRQYRICFQWRDQNATNVEIVDYH
ncbi:MAG: plasmid maintenance system killer protein [Spirulina sp. SIO3F2]|nr:plasmid maintenance system killer protein [Spirulina sp. SIO3F2]